MTYIAYVTVQYDHGKQLDEHGNQYSVAANIWMIIANVLLNHIYTSHTIVVVVHN